MAERKNGVPEEEELALINRFSQRELGAEEVFAFPVVLCDNEVDRDFDCFTPGTLGELAKLFVGKTGIFDHDPRGENQTARIYRAEAEFVPGRVNGQGEPYCRLKAHAYMVRAEKNRDLILEIEAGIKKEVSVGCTVEQVRCSVCGGDLRRTDCGHRKGQRYPDGQGGQKLCYHLLEGAADAYEWSFVAVPAQRGAGVTKGYCSGGRTLEKVKRAKDALTLNAGELQALGTELEELEQQAALGRQAEEELRRETARLQGLADPRLAGELAGQMMKGLSHRELMEAKRALEQRLAGRYPYVPQTFAETKGQEQAAGGLGEFRI